MPSTAHSATSGWEARISSMPPVESRWPATLMMSSVRPITIDIAVLVLIAGVGGFVVAGEFVEIGFLAALVLLPQRRQAARRQRQLDHDRAHGARRQRLCRLVDHVDLIARHRHRRRAVLDRQHAEPHRIAGDAPAGFGLPPMVDHRHLQLLLGPFHRRRIGALAGQKQRAEFRQIVLPDEFAVGVFLLDGAERGRRGEERHRLVLGDHPPERAGIRRADRLALIHDRGRAMKQRPVDDVAVADHPADVGAAPPDLAGLDAVEVEHRPFQRDQMPAIVAHHALGFSGGAGGVEDVERIGREHRHAGGGFFRGDGLGAQLAQS